MSRYIEQVKNSILNSLKKECAPWQKQLETGKFIPPFNPISNHRYSGINLLHILSKKENSLQSLDIYGKKINEMKSPSQKYKAIQAVGLEIY